MSDAMMIWLDEQLAKAEQALRAREQAVETWRGGTNASWAATVKFNGGGVCPSKKERLKIAEREARISVKCRRDVEMLKAVIAALTPPTASLER